MKYLFSFIIIVMIPVTIYSQKEELKNPDPFFIAVIVRDIDSSVAWYSDKLGFEISNRFFSEERGFKIANLERGDAMIELIELKNAVVPEETLAGDKDTIRITGFFKFGFRVTGFEEWIDHLIQSGAKFQGNVVQDKVTGKKMIIIKDPDGNRIQMFEQ